jgi:hypothetical protein
MQGLLPELVEECVSYANQRLRGYVRNSMDNFPKAVDLAASEALFQFALPPLKSYSIFLFAVSGLFCGPEQRPL